MIKVDSIAIKEFRGIRDLTLNFQGKCFAICGANGTGKSGVVGALEFGLTGNVSRLSGAGRGDVSLKVHGPHVDCRDPFKASVTLDMMLLDLNKKVTVTRNLKTPGKASVKPSEPAVLALLREIEDHPEIVLSRRELIRYVLATPGDRAQEVQALLQLSKVEQVRTVLQKIANGCQKKLSPLETAVTLAKESLKQALGISELAPEKILVAANEQRAILRLPILRELTPETSLSEGTAEPEPGQRPRIAKSQASADMQAARQAIEEAGSKSMTERASRMVAELTALGSDPDFEASATRASFYETGIKLIGSNQCPFCDLPWDIEELKKHVQAKIDRLAELSKKRTAIEMELEPLIMVVQKIQSVISALARYAELAESSALADEFRRYSTTCNTAIEKLTALVPILETTEILRSISAVPGTLREAADEMEKIFTSLPEPTAQDAAISWLAVAQERLAVFRDSEKRHQIAKAQAQTAHDAFEIYAKTNDKVLTSIYAAVEKEFAALYRFIHREDETGFTAKLIPSMGKLGFDVDFYGRGLFPPGAYHSEGHQDCMGLCLYIALMKHLQGEHFTLAILDDVLMSVDSSHRREVCALLKTQFPNTQFIMTTHDPLWLRHMRAEGLLQGRSTVQFRNWDVEHGPSQWDERDVWKEIWDYLKKNDVRAASALLRYFLEYVSTELCHRLRALVPFRGDDRYELGELLPSAACRMQNLYGSAKAAANSWNQRDVIEVIDDRSSAFGKLVAKCNLEQWQINAAVHYNSWANLSKEDFEPVVKSFKELLSGFMCLECNEYLRVSPDRQTPESLRCECGKITYNLKKKGE